MNDFKRLNELVRAQKAELNALYKNLDDEILSRALNLIDLGDTKSLRVALAHRIVALKPDPLENELKKLDISKDRRREILDLMFDFVREIYETRHAKLIAQVRNERILDAFYMVLVEGMHEVGLAINSWQKTWQARIINGTNREFEAGFSSLAQASEFIAMHGLFQTDEKGQKADRSYGAVVKISDFGSAKDFLEKALNFSTQNLDAASTGTGNLGSTKGEIYAFAPYAVAFENEVAAVAAALENMILNLETTARNLAVNNPNLSEHTRNLDLKFSDSQAQNLASNLAREQTGKAQILNEHASYIKYFRALKSAFCERKNACVIPAWQAAEVAWMDVRGALQPGHPLEYYEDAYTHAVALEWDIRLVDSGGVNECEFKANVIDTYERVCEQIGVQNEAKFESKNETCSQKYSENLAILNKQKFSANSALNLSSMHSVVRANIQRTQLYVSVPMVYYGAELNGLFSAQVVPNDEYVSAVCGKKIFAFVNHVYEAAKAKPFSRLSAEIFPREFLDAGRHILFCEPEIWKKIYEISTIGHEFGHILFIDQDTENVMNTSGAFKFIEEYKATTGGLMNFFYHEDARYKDGVFQELIARAVGLIGWRLVDDVRAYYCEALVHLSVLFGAGVLKFDGVRLAIDMSEAAYERFKAACMQNYFALASHYAAKRDASEFLERFCVTDGTSYLPRERKTQEFVKFYHARYEAIGNELDESGEWERWQARSALA